VDTKDTNSSNAISTRITNLPVVDLVPYRLISNSYTKSKVDTNVSNMSNDISARITNLSVIDSQPYRLISNSYTKSEVDINVSNTSNYAVNTSNLKNTRINNLV